MSRWSDVLVVGGGVIGGALAWSIAQRGLSVTLVEGGRIGRGSSWAAAGILAPFASGHEPPALAGLSEASLDLWPSWAGALEQATGASIQLRRDGVLNVWVDPEAPHLPPELATGPAEEIRGSHLSAAEVRELEPLLTGPIGGGILAEADAQVDNPRLTPALVQASANLGTRVLTDTTVTALTGVAGRCTGVRTASGVEISAGAVILAAGAWSGLLAEASGLRLPIEPWRGQMLRFDPPARLFKHMVMCGELVLVPRPHGPLIVGTTLERVGFDSRVTLAGIHHIVARARRVAPALGDLPMAATWAGLRPGTPDQLPYLGPIPGWDGLFAATGHGRKGIVLAPITAELLTRLILDHDLDPRLEPCLASRAVG